MESFSIIKARVVGTRFDGMPVYRGYWRKSNTDKWQRVVNKNGDPIAFRVRRAALVAALNEVQKCHPL
jgi:hypothetical protein